MRLGELEGIVGEEGATRRSRRRGAARRPCVEASCTNARWVNCKAGTESARDCWRKRSLESDGAAADEPTTTGPRIRALAAKISWRLEGVLIVISHDSHF